MRRLITIDSSISAYVADIAGHPLAIIGMLLPCTLWFRVGGKASENALTPALSVLAIKLTQMVLNQQRRSEAALHLEIDELILAAQGARDEIAGVEGATEEIEQLRRTARTGAACSTGSSTAGCVRQRAWPASSSR